MARAGAAAGVAALVLAWVFRFPMASGLARIFGDHYDGRIALALHEHWLGVATGAWLWLRPPWFFPNPRTLPFNDGYLLHGLFYVPARLLGADPALAANLAHAVLLLMLFVSVALLARRGRSRCPWAPHASPSDCPQASKL